MMKIFFYALREFDELPYCEELKQETGIDFDWAAAYPSMENADLAAGCDAVSFTPCAMPEKLMQKFKDLGVKYLTCRSIGYDHVDLNVAAKLGLRVSNISYTPNGVANYAIMLMLMSLRRMNHIMKRAELQDYSLKGKIGRDISDCTVGVIGTGSIGTTVVRHLSGFGCRILAYDLYPNEEAAKYAEYVDLDDLLAQSDAVTLHTNATKDNYHLINEQTLAKMKDEAVIVNTARGKLIDSKALIQALKSGKIGAAALDVVENENGLYYYNHMGDVMDQDQLAILRSFPNVIVSPHTAFYTRRDVRQMVEGIFQSVQCFQQGIENPHEVKIK
ncbi:MAG: D-isomer specific 2-hydroxyacid dehydrogenase family protein [Catenisphaera adipataccumulans]|uniref:D-isomer specific 2-hydroxyacid dehydrogenase family protein n=1 Tax=Catenisphaera adipataccumulans TaxID=700500 RepID=UPI003D934350